MASPCGARVKKPRSLRPQVCPSCGLVLDRDSNAALTSLAAALAVVAQLRTAGQAETGAGAPEQHAAGQTATTRGVRQGTSHAGWMTEASPGASFGECQS